MSQKKTRRRLLDGGKVVRPLKLYSRSNKSPEQETKWRLVGLSKVVKVLLALLVTVAIIVLLLAPIVFRASSTIQRALVFMNYVNFGLSHPEEHGLECTRNFQLNSSDSVQLGVWHILPGRENCPHSSEPWSEQDLFADDKMVVLYIHGMGGTRASRHRVQLYKKLSSELQAHVITFDYRGYGDSSNVWPHSDGMVKDTAAIYEWLLDKGVPNRRILLWGHSMGTAVAVRHLSTIASQTNPVATVLEAPFTNFREAIVAFPLCRLFTYLPYFEYFFVEPLVQNPDTNFDSLTLLHRVQSPLLILHAEDDMIVPFSMGKRLHDEAHQLQPENVSRPTFQSFEKHKGYGHKNIFLDPELPQIVDRFIKSITIV